MSDPDFPGTPANGVVSYVDEAGIGESTVRQVLRHTDVARAISEWMAQIGRARTEAARGPDPFGRTGFRREEHVFARMARCALAVEADDILSTIADVTEGLAFQRMKFEMVDLDQQDVWNQWAARVDLDARLRECWRELFKVSQVYVALRWRRQTFRVRDRQGLENWAGETDYQGRPLLPFDGPPPERKGGNRRRKKEFDLLMPSGLTVLDPTKVLPIGSTLFGGERFAYIADDGEDGAFMRTFDGEIFDPLVLELIEGRYRPDPADVQLIQELEVDPTRLWLLRADAVFRHTLTRAGYERWPALRLWPCVEILDLKRHLRMSDRATLVGSSNAIVLIKKGTDKHPAQQPELDNLHEMARVVARMPVLIGDHRLTVEIVTPSLDKTLTEGRWHVLDARLVNRALGSYAPSRFGASASGGTQVSELSRVVARGIENRRHGLKRAFEGKLLRVAVARNPGQLDETPGLEFAPKRVTLDLSADVLNATLKLRDRGDLSRNTTLEEFDFDQEHEFSRRMLERREYDPAFASSVPHSSPVANPFATKPGATPDQNGLEGGRPPGVAEDEPRQRRT